MARDVISRLRSLARKSTTMAKAPNPAFFLLKGEPEPDLRGGLDVGSQPLSAFSSPALYSGVRNRQAAGILRTAAPGDLALFYHAGTKKPAHLGLAGVVRVIQMLPDPTAATAGHPFFDAKHTPAAPVWHALSLQRVETFPSLLTLAELKAAAVVSPILASLTVLKQPRLSVSRVTQAQWDEVLALARDAR